MLDKFKIRRIEGGYDVRTAEGKLLGVAPSFAEARNLLPDGAHERLYRLHGLQLSGAARVAILEKGSPPGVERAINSAQGVQCSQAQ